MWDLSAKGALKGKNRQLQSLLLLGVHSTLGKGTPSQNKDIKYLSRMQKTIFEAVVQTIEEFF